MFFLLLLEGYIVAIVLVLVLTKSLVQGQAARLQTSQLYIKTWD